MVSINAHVASYNMGGYGRLLSLLTLLTSSLGLRSGISCLEAWRPGFKQELCIRAGGKRHQSG